MDNIVHYMALGSLLGVVLPWLVRLVKSKGVPKEAAVAAVSLSIGGTAALVSILWSFLSQEIQGEILVFAAFALQVSDVTYKYILKEQWNNLSPKKN